MESSLRKEPGSKPQASALSLNIEDHDELLRYLRQTGRVHAGERPRLTNLKGGISNRVVLVERPGGGALVLKQALPKLRVATDWPSDPRRSQQEALALAWLSRIAPPGAIPSLLYAIRRPRPFSRT